MNDKILDTVKPFTCIGQERQMNLVNAVKTTFREEIPGDLIECGTWKCGALALMTLVDDELGGTRIVRGFDSFEGLPQPTAEDGRQAVGWKGALKVSLSEAQDNLRRMGATRAVLHQGFFEDSLSVVKKDIQSIAVLRLDGDWYQSTLTVLNELYDLVSPGGYIIIDDYGHWEGCKVATDEFRSVRSIKEPLIKTDYTEFWWRKSL